MVVEDYYNTNYTASWLLVRSRPRLDKDGNLIAESGCTPSLNSRGSTAGPLRIAELDSSQIPSTIIPLLGDGGVASTLQAAIGPLALGTPTTISTWWTVVITGSKS